MNPKIRRLRDRRQRQCIERGYAVGAHRLGAAQQPGFVDEARGDKG